MGIRARRLLLSAAITTTLLHSACDTASAQQHGAGCSCSACSQQAQPTADLIDQSKQPRASLSSGASSLAAIGQTVLLDFDSGIATSVNYTQAIRDEVFDRIETIYGGFGVDFVDSAPVTGPFSTITFNQGPSGGIADGIDFRNLNQSDNASVNLAGVTTSTAASTVAGFSANIAAHELGHLLGLRHRDAFGPIGSGLSPELASTALNPSFPGPSNGTETNDHVLSTPALGAPNERFEDPVWFSERSAIKLAAITQLNTVDEAISNDSIATAQLLGLGELVVPNTIVSGVNAGLGDFDVDALSVIGNISSDTDLDFFSFEGEAGDLFNIEVTAAGNDNVLGSLDSEIRILDGDGNFIEHFGADAFNDNEIETFDALILDLVLPESGTFFIQINSFQGDGFFPADPGGDYELFITRFNGAISAVAAVPEPSSLILIAFSGSLCCFVRRRRVSLN